MAHALAYVMVNLLLVAVWFVTGAGFFWPVFPLFGWGIGMASTRGTSCGPSRAGPRGGRDGTVAAGRPRS